MRLDEPATPRPPRSAPWIGYAGALLISAIAIGARLALTPVFQDRPFFLLFMPAVLLAAAFWGPGPALLTTAVTLAGGVMISGLTPQSHSGDLINAALFTILGPAIAYGGWRLQRQVARTADALVHLEEREAHLRSILDTVPDAMVVIDEHGV